MKQHRNLMTHAWTVTAMLILATASRLLAQVPGYTATTVGNLVGGYGIGLDTNGNLYICYGNLIQKISTTGTVSTVAGGGQNTGGLIGDGGPATSATLSYPIGVAVDSAGNLYIAEYAGNRIRKVSTIGTITTVAGPGSTNGALGDGGPATSATLSGPRGVAVDSAGNVYIADSGHARVRKVSLDGTIATVAGGSTASALGDGGPATSAALSNPGGVTVDSAGNIYIADSDHNRVRQVSPAGIITTVAGNGTGGYSGDGGLATIASINAPWGVAVDSAGTIYIADHSNNRLRIVTADGNINTIAGGGSNSPGNNGPATGASLSSPVGVALGSGGKVYVSASSLRLLTPSATPVVPAPSFATDPAGAPAGVASASGWGQFTQLGLGSWISIYGSYLAPDSRSWAGTDFKGMDAPTSLDGTSVTIGGQPAFISYISPGQINAQVPTNIGTGVQPLTVTTSTGTTAVYPVTVNPSEPGLLAPASFLFGFTQYVVALFQDGVTFVLPSGQIAGVPSRPAVAGDVITLYGIGFGSVVPNTPAGQIVQTTTTLALAFHLFFQSTEAQVTYAGLAPGVVGLYQFNVTVPKLSAGGNVPLTFTLGGASGAQALSIAVE